MLVRERETAMAEQDLSPARVEAFSDGVIAIIITIMVLELHVPMNGSPTALRALWPTFASYALSYLLVSIYWINHHNLFSIVRKVSLPILWANIALLFFMSLIPFFTAYVGQTRMSSLSVLLYALSMFMAGMAFYILRAAISIKHFHDSDAVHLANRAAERKNKVALAIYVLAMIAAYWHPAVSMTLVLLVAVTYLVPVEWVE
jgi:uncharacterized membrane protein